MTGLTAEEVCEDEEDHDRIWVIGIDNYGRLSVSMCQPTDRSSGFAERATYRLLGNWDLRAFARAIGSKDFTTSSGTDAANEVFDSTSLRGSGVFPEA